VCTGVLSNIDDEGDNNVTGVLGEGGLEIVGGGQSMASVTTVSQKSSYVNAVVIE
jgi:hypothetical protein